MMDFSVKWTLCSKKSPLWMADNVVGKMGKGNWVNGSDFQDYTLESYTMNLNSMTSASLD